MRLALCAALTFSAPALADQFTVFSAPNEVTVYAQGALVTRHIPVDLPAGSHDIILPDLPGQGFRPVSLGVDGATLNGSRTRANALSPVDATEAAAIKAAKDQIEQIEAQITDIEDQIAIVRLGAEAAAAQIAFLAGLGSQENLTQDVTTLRDIALMIGTETLAARRQALDAGLEERKLTKTRSDLKEDLTKAQDALAALTPRTAERSQLSLSVVAQEAGEVMVHVEYYAAAHWQPTYDVFLDQNDAAQVLLKRGAMVQQYSGENWDDVKLSLSTLNLSDQLHPSDIFPQQIHLLDPNLKRRGISSMSAADTERLEGFVTSAPAPVMAEAATAQASFDGPGVTYTVPDAVTIANEADLARVALDRLTFDAKVFARAVPLRDETAFLMADIKNTSAEPILASFESVWYVDNTQIGTAPFPAIPAGAQADLPFGSLQGLRLTRTVLDRREGDRGLLGRTNARIEEVRIDIENLTGQTWPIEVLDRVPYSENEDLEVNWTASPRPTNEDHNDQRGILRWSFDLGAATTQSVSVEQDIRWPDGQQIR